MEEKKIGGNSFYKKILLGATILSLIITIVVFLITMILPSAIDEKKEYIREMSGYWGGYGESEQCVNQLYTLYVLEEWDAYLLGLCVLVTIVLGVICIWRYIRPQILMLSVIMLVCSVSACGMNSEMLDSNEQERVLVEIEETIIDGLDSHVDVYYEGSVMNVNFVKIKLAKDENEFDAYGKVTCIDKYGDKCTRKFVVAGSFYSMGEEMRVDSCNINMTPLRQ